MQTLKRRCVVASSPGLGRGSESGPNPTPSTLGSGSGPNPTPSTVSVAVLRDMSSDLQRLADEVLIRGDNDDAEQKRNSDMVALLPRPPGVATDPLGPNAKAKPGTKTRRTQAPGSTTRDAWRLGKPLHAPRHSSRRSKGAFGSGRGGKRAAGDAGPNATPVDVGPPQQPPQRVEKHWLAQCIAVGDSCVRPCCGALCFCRACCGTDAYGDPSCGCGQCSGECITDTMYIQSRKSRLIIMSVIGLVAFFCLVVAAIGAPILLPGLLLPDVLPAYFAVRFRMIIPVYDAASAAIPDHADSDAWDCKVAVVYILVVAGVVVGGVLPTTMGSVGVGSIVLYVATHMLMGTVAILQLVGVLKSGG